MDKKIIKSIADNLEEVRKSLKPSKEEESVATSEEKTFHTLESAYRNIREKSDRERHYKGATKPEGLLDKEGEGSKKYAEYHVKNTKIDDTEEKGHKDVVKAGRANASQASSRNGTDKLANGDKSVVNPVKPVPGQVADGDLKMGELKKEDTEHLDEISQKLKNRYIRKALSSVANSAWLQGNADSHKDKLRHYANTKKRTVGIKRATKESVEEDSLLEKTVTIKKKMFDSIGKKYAGKTGKVVKVQDDGIHHVKFKNGRTVEFRKGDFNEETKKGHLTRNKDGSYKIDSGWHKQKEVVTDKSGAKHTPMSRARHLAKLGLGKVKKEDVSVEDQEQIDEISKETYGKYIKKAASDIERQKKKERLYKDQPKSKAYRNAARRLQGRKAGISHAVDKLTKEETLPDYPLTTEKLYEMMKANPDASVLSGILKDIKGINDSNFDAYCKKAGYDCSNYDVKNVKWTGKYNTITSNKITFPVEYEYKYVPSDDDRAGEAQPTPNDKYYKGTVRFSYDTVNGNMTSSEY